MSNEPFKSVLHLVGQFSVPVEDVVEAEELYRQLKEMLKNYSPDITIGGQIQKLLEPCCKKPPVIPAQAGIQNEGEKTHDTNP